MTPHVKIYMVYFDYAVPEEIVCEACGSPAVEIHHIQGRGKDKNVIINLMALCRKSHERAHGTKNYVSKEEFQYIHNNFMWGNRRAFLK
jgi:hypothetical protein